MVVFVFEFGLDSKVIFEQNKQLMIFSIVMLQSVQCIVVIMLVNVQQINMVLQVVSDVCQQLQKV